MLIVNTEPRFQNKKTCIQRCQREAAISDQNMYAVNWQAGGWQMLRMLPLVNAREVITVKPEDIHSRKG